MQFNGTDRNFDGYPKFFIKVDGECETVTFDCIDNHNRKSICKKHRKDGDGLFERIVSCLLSYASDQALIEKRARLIASNCIKQDAHFKYLGFMDKDALEAFMMENFTALCSAKPKEVGWRRFLLDIGAIYENNNGEKNG